MSAKNLNTNPETGSSLNENTCPYCAQEIKVVSQKFRHGWSFYAFCGCFVLVPDCKNPREGN
jgi:hypothetical protein